LWDMFSWATSGQFFFFVPGTISISFELEIDALNNVLFRGI
jgi:hypothetical protein